MAKYAVSKALAEQAVWKLIREERLIFDLVTLVPSFVFGFQHDSSLASQQEYWYQSRVYAEFSEFHCVNVRALAERRVRDPISLLLVISEPQYMLSDFRAASLCELSNNEP